MSLGLALIALIMVAIAENARIPVDNPATHLELTMVHEAMVLEYSGRHLALIELAASLKLVLYISLIACVFVPWGLAPASAGLAAWRSASRVYSASSPSAVPAGAVRDLDRQDARLPCAGISRRRADAGPAGDAPALRVAGASDAWPSFDIAHLLAGGLVLVSFMLLYQDRLYALLNVFALHALVLSPRWPGRPTSKCAASLCHRRDRARAQGHRHSGRAAPDVVRLGIHREIETVVGVGPTMLAGMGLVRCRWW